MLRIINIILVILIGLSIAFFTNDTQDSKRQEVVEIYPGDTGDRYDELKELLGSEKASTE